jgi:HD-GYP domain-containing protein (c-di-GMP phosphodiesterase class II)
MRNVDYSKHAKTTPLAALAFRSAARYEPALEGLVRAYVSRYFIEEREQAGEGIRNLVRAGMARLNEGEGKRKNWSYTRAHSLEVARFSYVMARQAQEQGVGGSGSLDAKLVFAGGLMHDVGKTFMPRDLLARELGVDFGLFTAFRNASLSAVERRIIREEHLATGTRYVRLFGGGPHIRMMLDMVGLHHVMYNGMDSGVPSYPSLLRGMDLPLHARIAKAADFISAVMPRHYRTNGYISSLDGAVAYAITAAGTELDPVAVRCFITGFYDSDPDAVGALVDRLKHPMGQEGVSDIHNARLYARDVVLADQELRSILSRRATRREFGYDRELEACSSEYGLRLNGSRSS